MKPPRLLPLPTSLLPLLLILLLRTPAPAAGDLLVEMMQAERFLINGYIVASFEIKLDDETCREFLTPGVVIRESTSIDPNDYFAITLTPDKAKAVMKVTRAPDPDAVEYFRDMAAQVSIGSSQPDRCDASVGGVKMQITDSNDNKPVFDSAAQILKVAENLNSLVDDLYVKADDADYDKTTNGKVTFRLAGVTPPEYKDIISLDETTGQLTIDPSLSSTKLFDRETHPQINLQIEASDNPTENVADPIYGKHVVTETIVLKVMDANDNAPKDCRLSTSTCKVREDQAVQGILKDCLVVCEDADETPVFK